MLSIFVSRLYLFIGEISAEVLCPLINWIVYLSVVELYELFIGIFWIPKSCQIHDIQIVLPIL